MMIKAYAQKNTLLTNAQANAESIFLNEYFFATQENATLL